MPSSKALNSLSLEQRQPLSQNIRQLQRMIMSRQMQQAIHLLQVPVMEITPLVDLEMEENPVLEYSEDAVDEDAEQKPLDDEDEEEDEIAPEKQLIFDDNDFEILRRLDADFRDHFQQSGSAFTPQSEQDEELKTFLESSIKAKISFFEHLTTQANEAFNSEKELAIAEAIIGSLDESGFLTTPLKEIAMLQGLLKGPLQGLSEEELEKVLKVIQTFHPPGVAALNLKSCLLTQLKMQGKESSLAFKIIDCHFDDLIHNRIAAIGKATGSTLKEIGLCIDQEIAKLDLHPRAQLKSEVAPYVIPDVTINQEGDELTVSLNEDSQPQIRLNSKYLKMLDDDTLPQETKNFIKTKILSAKWLMRNIMKRNKTLESIAEYLTKHQRTFFLEPRGQLIPLTMKAVADEIEVHESTVARAVSNKYIDTPKGILPLRSFFTSSLETKEGDGVSSQTVKEILKKLIDQEDKQKPLSDEALSKMIEAKGIKCARRTVAKYRLLLKLGTAQQRRKF